MTPPVTFYGHFSGLWSYPAVSRQIAKWLFVRGVNLELCDIDKEGLYSGVRGIDQVDEFTAQIVRANLGMLGKATIDPEDIGDDEAEGVSLTFSRPGIGRAIPRHEHRVAFAVVDTDHAPPAWTKVLSETADVVLTPSAWSRQSLIDGGLTVPCHIVQHGVDGAFVREESGPVGGTRLGFFCTALSGERKGVPEFIAALQLLHRRGVISGDDVVTYVEPGPEAEMFDAVGWLADREAVTEPLGAPKRVAAELRGLGLLVVPSRAEGFGLLGLEALCCGTPVVATDCTGHAEWARGGKQGFRRVPTSGLAPSGIDPDYCLPEIAPYHLADSIEFALANLQRFQAEAWAEAKKLGRYWSWDSALSHSSLLEALQQI